jgi:glycosyltransferase involved in cell wall biosynthesis
MRILELCTNFRPGGIQRHALDLSAWLASRGHAVTLAGEAGAWAGPEAGTGAGPGGGRVPPGCAFRALPFGPVSGEGGGIGARLIGLGRAVRALRRLLREFRPEAIHAHESAPALVALLARIGTGIPLAVTFHGADPARLAGFARIAGRAERVVALSDRSARALAQAGVAEARLRRLGLGLSPPPAADPAAVAALRAQYLGPGGRVLVLTLARIAHQKGIDILIETAAQVRAARPDLRFVLAGDGPLRAEMAALSAARGDPVLFAGRTDAPHLALAAADLLLLPSRWEERPFVIGEAFQAGRPVVATDTGGVAELVDPATGRVVPPGDAGALAAALLGLLADPAALTRMGEAARTAARDPRFDPEAVHGAYEALYRGMAG